jgi:hypothetical protein
MARRLVSFIPSPGPGLWVWLSQQMVPPNAFPPTTPVPNGMYRVVLSVDGQDFTQGVRVDPDPIQPAPAIITEGPEGAKKQQPWIDD